MKNFKKAFAILLSILIINSQINPTGLMALTSGPSSPDFSGFTEASTDGLVNEFTGDFNYSIPVITVPGPHGSSYPLNLTYNSGVKPEEEASWVGYGWSLNAGVINRQKRGIADDSKGNSIEYKNKVEENFDEGFGMGLMYSYAYGGFSVQGGPALNLGFNNNTGLAKNIGYSIDVCGFSGSYNRGLNSETGTYTVGFNPIVFASSLAAKGNNNNNSSSSVSSVKNKNVLDFVSNKFDNALKIFGKRVKQSLKQSLNINYSSNYGVWGTNNSLMPVTIPEYNANNIMYSASVAVSIPTPYGTFGGSATVSSDFQELNFQENKTKAAYGLLYSSYAGENDLMDYNSERNEAFKRNDEFLPIPFSNPDLFLATANGLNGGFRAYSKNIGQFKQAKSVSKTTSQQYGDALSNASPTIYSQSEINGTNKSIVKGWTNPSTHKFTDSEDESYFFAFNGDLGSNVITDETDEPVQAKLNKISGSNELSNSDREKFSDEIIEKMKQSDFLHSALLEWYIDKNAEVNEQVMDEYDFAMKIIQDFDVDLSDIPTKVTLNDNDRVGRSSFIGFHTNNQINNGLKHNFRTDFSDFIDRAESDIEYGIGEFVIYNQSGTRYMYGLPVYSRNEESIQYGLDEADMASLENNRLVYKDISDEAKIKTIIGQTSSTPYASSFLLTEVTTPDYVDRTLDGPTEDDFGGWTKFNYVQKYGSKTKEGTGGDWYPWRIPYEGLLYNKGEHSTTDDDVAFANSGEKEVYYLNSVETKTHIAVFELSKRLDAVAAADNEAAATGSFIITSLPRMYRLDKIKLYAKDKNGDAGELIKTVNFQYDYSLCSGIPNTIGTGTDREGKLTLKKVWFDYENIKEAFITPYEFSYSYKKTSEFSSGVVSKYNDIVSFASSSLIENPDYNINDNDPWGNYQYNGSEMASKYRNFVKQRNDTEFDPAAWNLKGIKLPTGGELLVQYEQTDYQKVQNLPVYTMVSLKDISGTGIQDEKNSNNKYYLNLSDMDLSGQNITVNELKDYLYDFFVTGKQHHNKLGYENGDFKKIYAKFLYALTPSFSPGIKNCGSEYIDYYMDVTNVGFDKNGLYIELGESDYHANMREICVDKVKASKQGIIDKCWSADVLDKPEFNKAKYTKTKLYKALNVSSIKPIDTARALFTQITNDFWVSGYAYPDFVNCDDPVLSAIVGSNCKADLIDTIGSKFNNIMNTSTNAIMVDWALEKSQGYCKELSVEDSYFRIPINFNKKGGGIRVKRVLTYDAGINNNEEDAVLYGNEYLYQLKDGTSSGVASNEPEALGTENALVQNLTVAENQEWSQSNRILGFDKRQTSGPLAENILPSSVVGHSRVVIKNIHSGKTNPGFEIKKFYTTNDFPVEIKSTDIEYEDFNPVIPIDFGSDFLYASNSLLLKDCMDKYNAVVGINNWIKNLFKGESQENNASEMFDWINDLNNVPLAPDPSDIIEFFSDCSKDDDGFIECTKDKWGAAKDYIKSFIEFLLKHTDKQNHNLIWATQGYSVVLNDMHGQPSYEAHCEGNYDEINTPDDESIVTASKTYEYLQAGDKVKLMNGFNSDEFAEAFLGKTMEITMESRAISNNYSATGTNMVKLAALKAFLQNLTGKTNVDPKIEIESDNEFYYHSTSKMVHYPSVLNKINTYSNGVKTESEMTAFNQENGSVLVNTTYDEFHGEDLEKSTNHDGTYTSYSKPATQIYENTGQKAFNQSYKFSSNSDVTVTYNRTTDNPVIELSGSSSKIAEINDMVLVGDLVSVSHIGGVAYHHVKSKNTSGTEINLYKTDGFRRGSKQDAEVEILNSANTNQLNAAIGSLLTYGNKNMGKSNKKDVFVLPSKESLVSITDELNKAIESLDLMESISVNLGLVDLNSLADTTNLDTTQFTQLNNVMVLTELGEGQMKVTISNENGSETMTVYKDGAFGLGADGNIQYVENAVIDNTTGSMVDSKKAVDLGISYINKNKEYAIADCDTLYNVLAASAIKLSSYWNMPSDMDETYETNAASNPYLIGERGKWRVNSNYVYNKSIIGGNQDEDGERVYLSAGVADTFFTFDWEATKQNENWVKATTVNYYSPNGKALEEKNIYGVSSAAKFGYNHELPYIIAQNSEYNSVFFESFENEYNGTDSLILEDGFKVDTLTAELDNSVAHSGKNSLKLKLVKETDGQFNGALVLKPMEITDQIIEEGITAKLWVKVEDPTIDEGITLFLASTSAIKIVEMNKVARVWDWDLFEIDVTDMQNFVKGEELRLMMAFQSIDEETGVWFDDARVQPFNSEMLCYVYDTDNLRLLTSFDSQHFGFYSQYNAEGKLIRKIVETERGKRTIKETHYFIPGSLRPEDNEYISNPNFDFDEDNTMGTIKTTPETAEIVDPSGSSLVYDKSKVNTELIKYDDSKLQGELVRVDDFMQIYYETDLVMYEMLDAYAYVTVYNFDMLKVNTTVITENEFVKEFYDNYATKNSDVKSFVEFEKALSNYKTYNTTTNLNFW